MQRIVLIIIFLIAQIISQISLAQDWDDFEPPPPPPSDFGNIPPPPPPPMPSMPPPDNGSPVFNDNPVVSDGPRTGGGKTFAAGGSRKLGDVEFKKTGTKKDVSKKNPRIEELLKEYEDLNH